MNQPTCAVWYCESPCKPQGRGRGWKKVCTTHEKRPYSQHKKDHCEECGFIPQHMIQLDVDHIDGDRKNNDVSNLQTLCANCHRLKTKVHKDHLGRNH